MNINKRSLQYMAFSLTWCALSAINTSVAAPLTISQEPLFLDEGVDPNVLLVVDDSGSMGWEVLMSQDAITAHGSSNNKYDLDFTPNDNTESRELCVAYNLLAYDPSKTYTPWAGVDEDGTAYPDITDLTKALENPYYGHGSDDSGNLDDISGHFYIIWDDSNSDGTYQSGECEESIRDISDCNSDSSCFVVNTDLNASKQQNYANWYSYYRERLFITKKAMLDLIDGTAVRAGLGTMHNRDSVGTVIKDMDDEDNATTQDVTDKATLMAEVSKIRASSGTPTRNALYEAGEYFKNGSGTLMGLTNPGTPILSDALGGACQQNFTVLLSDGFETSSFSYSVGNRDNDGGSGTDDTVYDGGDYSDSVSNTLADVAMKYYEEDLSSLDDAAPSDDGSGNLMHQHMVTYTVAFGLTGDISCNPTTDTSCRPTWPDPVNLDTTATIDDLAHAAFNGRGLFLSAETPQTLIDGLADAIDNIAARTSSSAAVAANSTTLNQGTVVYQATFNTGDWHGDLRSRPVSIGATDPRAACSGVTAGSICSTDDWQAATIVNAQNYDTGRVILTSNAVGAAKGIAFRWPTSYASPTTSDLSASQISELLVNAPTGTEQAYGADLLNYLRGDQSNEGTNGQMFRERLTSVLGDIINSAPTFVGVPAFGYPDSLESTTYESFATGTAASRTKMVYVGSNDGMLHGFDSSTGEEKLAYIPSTVYSNIESLADVNYTHRFSTDGSPTIGDAYYSNNWHSVLVSGLRAGGQTVFALDVTNPSKFTEVAADIADVVMWEYTDDDLGYTFSRPDIVKLNNGTWAAIFGNGYNNTEADGSASATGFAYLYIVNLETGALIKKISTNTGSTVTPNGLATVTPVDIDSDYMVDYVYAGDLEGNLWKFDLTGTSTSGWDTIKSGGLPTPLFTTASPETGNPAQPITTRPSVAFHPDAQKTGFLIYFGTGRYIDVTDNLSTGQDTQTFYGVWDDPANLDKPPSFSRSNTNYLQQAIIGEATVSGNNVRASSKNAIDWSTQYGWYMDLVDPTASPVDNKGERQVTNSIVRGDRVVFTTLVPNGVACKFGGDSWLMELDSSNGGRLDSPPLDINNDGIIDATDVVTINGVDYPASGVQQDGIITEPAIVGSPDADKEYKFFNSSAGSTSSVLEKPPGGLTGQRKSWSERSF